MLLAMADEMKGRGIKGEGLIHNLQLLLHFAVKML